MSSFSSTTRQAMRLALVAAGIVLSFSIVVNATSRLESASASIKPASAANPSEGAAQRIMHVAAASLQSTYTALDPTSNLFPDVVDITTGRWHMDDVNANGAAGLLAGSLWSMYKLTGNDAWRARALSTTTALRTSVDDVSMGQAIGTLAYPALRYAYEAEMSEDLKKPYLDAALIAATTLSKLYAKIPGVLKVRPTSDISIEARQAGAAVISPLAVFSSPEGSAAATGLLAWAATLPGGRAAWKDMALTNAKRIASDHLTDDGSIKGTLIYKSTSAKAEPKELASGSSKTDSPSMLSSLLESITGDHSSSSSPSAILDAWLSTVGGQATSAQLRQALTTLTLVEAVRSADCPTDAESLLVSAEAAAASLVSMATNPDTLEPVVAATTAAALAELSSLTALSQSQRVAYSTAARHIVVFLASSSLSSTDNVGSNDQQGQTLEVIATRWISSIVPKLQSHSAKTLRGASLTSSATSAASSVPLASILIGSSPVVTSDTLLPTSPESEGQSGSMLADFMLLKALEVLTVPTSHQSK